MVRSINEKWTVKGDNGNPILYVWDQGAKKLLPCGKISKVVERRPRVCPPSHALFHYTHALEYVSAPSQPQTHTHTLEKIEQIAEV